MSDKLADKLTRVKITRLKIYILSVRFCNFFPGFFGTEEREKSPLLLMNSDTVEKRKGREKNFFGQADIENNFIV